MSITTKVSSNAKTTNCLFAQQPIHAGRIVIGVIGLLMEFDMYWQHMEPSPGVIGLFMEFDMCWLHKELSPGMIG